MYRWNFSDFVNECHHKKIKLKKKKKKCGKNFSIKAWLIKTLAIGDVNLIIYNIGCISAFYIIGNSI